MMARLSKNERIRQHNRVYGKTFSVTDKFIDEDITVMIKVTKLIKKGIYDRLHVTISGNIAYDFTPILCFAHITWTKFGPVFKQKGGNVKYLDDSMINQIVKGCEAVLLETFILEKPNEQETKT